jgi:hypothetical protein
MDVEFEMKLVRYNYIRFGLCPRNRNIISCDCCLGSSTVCSSLHDCNDTWVLKQEKSVKLSLETRINSFEVVPGCLRMMGA